MGNIIGPAARRAAVLVCWVVAGSVVLVGCWPLGTPGYGYYRETPSTPDGGGEPTTPGGGEPATPGGDGDPAAPGDGGEPTAPDGEEPPAPTGQTYRNSWTIAAADFGGAGRSRPFRWNRITAANANYVRVWIGGQELPLTSTAARPVFSSDTSGAAWTVRPEVSSGQVVLALTAPDSRRSSGEVDSVTMTSPGERYSSPPTVRFEGTASRPAAGTATILGRVGSVTVTEGGSGYTSAPTVTFSRGDGNVARGTAVLDGKVTSVTVTNRGRGYLGPSGVTFSGGGGRGAAGTVTMSGGVTSVRVNRGGCYTAFPTVEFAAPPSGGSRATGTVNPGGGCVVESVTVTNSGSGYPSPPAVTFSGGTTLTAGATAQGEVTGMEYHEVHSVTITNGGSGYTSAPTVTFDAHTFSPLINPFFLPIRATGTATIDRSVASVRIDYRGRGYSSAPAVTFSGGSGIGAAATAALRAGVLGVTITDPGAGYTAAPTVTFSGGSGFGAAGTAVLARQTGGNSRDDNLRLARQTLTGKQLAVQAEDE